MSETLRTDERDTSLREVTGWDSPAYNHLLFFTNKLEKELAAERERADRNQEDAERYRSLIDATEINADNFTWSRNEKAKSATIVAEMNAIFGMTEE